MTTNVATGNFPPLEVVHRYRDPQPQVVENYLRGLVAIHCVNELRIVVRCCRFIFYGEIYFTLECYLYNLDSFAIKQQQR